VIDVCSAICFINLSYFYFIFSGYFGRPGAPRAGQEEKVLSAVILLNVDKKGMGGKSEILGPDQ